MIYQGFIFRHSGYFRTSSSKMENEIGRIEDLQVFILVIENRGISKVAEKLNISKSAVSRSLQLLEDRYSTKLINRTPGKWSVTEIGRELYQRAVGTAGDFEEIDADFKNTQNTISG